MRPALLALVLFGAAAHAFEDPACMRRCGGGDVNRQAQCIQTCEYAPAAPTPILDTWRVTPEGPRNLNLEDLRPARDPSDEIDQYIRSRGDK